MGIDVQAKECRLVITGGEIVMRQIKLSMNFASILPGRVLSDNAGGASGQCQDD